MSDPQPEDAGTKVRKANQRGAARLAAVQALYQMDMTGLNIADTVAEFETLRIGKELDGEEYLKADINWFRGIVAGVVDEQKALDPLINRYLPDDWPLSRLDILLRAIFRAAVFELQNRQSVPEKVVISEYLDVANAFFEEDEPKLVNGVLDRIAQHVRNGGEAE